jgi:hypothetical protein
MIFRLWHFGAAGLQVADCILQTLTGWRGPFIPFVPAPDCLVAKLHAALEQQGFDVVQAQLRPELPTQLETDNRNRRAVSMTKQFRFLHHANSRDGIDHVWVRHWRLTRAIRKGRVRDAFGIDAPALGVLENLLGLP